MTQLHTRSRPLASVYCGLAAAITLMLAGTAGAQDFPDSPDPAPFDWSGLYAGVTAGGGFTQVRTTDTGRGPSGSWYATGASVDDEGAGFIGGVRAGYNHAFDQVVIGVEAGISAANIHQRVEALDVFGKTDIDWLATVRGRAGVVIPDTPTPILLYGTGGLAVAGVKHTIEDTLTWPGRGLFGPNSETATRTGYTVGGGVEVALTERAVLGFEYLYTDLGRAAVDGICVVCFGGSTPGTPFVFDFDTKLHTVRLNLSWKFGG